MLVMFVLEVLVMLAQLTPTTLGATSTGLAACSPNACTCQNASSGLRVECQNRSPKLTEVPHSIPEDTAVLSLGQNKITFIMKGHFMRLEELRTLFLQQNQIRYIQPGAFDNLYKLEALVLYDNQLPQVSDNMFQHLPSLAVLDLGRNQISFVDKRAFLTLPAGGDANREVIIRMNGNQVDCSCDALAIRDWRRSMAPTLAKIKFEGFQCANGIELDSMRDQDFPSCTTSQRSVFESNQKCVSCGSVFTMHDCDKTPEAEAQTCTASQPVCRTHVVILNGRISLNKRCGLSYSSCLLKERENQRTCNISHSVSPSYMSCTFCCAGDMCNYGDVGGRTNSYTVYVGLRTNRQFQPYMHDPTSRNYLQTVTTYTQQMDNIFSQVDGAFSVQFISFRNHNPGVFMSFVVFATTLNSVEMGQVVQLLTQQINESAVQGFLKNEGVNFIYVGNQLASAAQCAREVLPTEVGVLDFAEVAAGTTTVIACPTGTVLGAVATRRCYRDSATGAATWANPDVDACKTSTSDTTRKLLELNNTAITASNVNAVLEQLQDVTSDGPELIAKDVQLSMDTVDKALASPRTLQRRSAMKQAVDILSNLAEADQAVLAEANAKSKAAERLLSAADKIAEEGQLSNGQLMLSSDNLVVAAQEVDPNNFNGLSVTAQPTGNDGDFEEGDVELHSTEMPPSTDETSSLVVPRSLVTSNSGTRLAMLVHRDDKIFQAVKRSKRQPVTTSDGSQANSKVNSYVMAASMVGKKIENLQEPIIYTLVHNDTSAQNPLCIFWDVVTSDWSTRGCSQVVARSTVNTTVCQCNHLTNFALLMDVYQQGDTLSKTDAKILSYLSYIGCGVSLVCLILTLLTYCLFKKLRRDNPSKILVNLCVALALSNLVFVAGMHPYALNDSIGCKVVAVLLHFSLLSSLCWMAVEAFYMYLALVLVFKTYYTKFLLKCSLVGWGIPLLVIVITLGVNKTDNYATLSTGVCWLQGAAFYVAFVGPVGLILLINVLAFAMVVYQIAGMKDRKLNKSDSFSVLQRLRGAVGVAILLGLTWVFGFLSVTEDAATVFYYLFTISNCLQGLWIFLFYCVMKKEARKSWLRCCRDSQLDKSGVTTSKAAYSGTAAGGRGAGKTSTEATSSIANTASTSVPRSFNSDTEPEATYANGSVTPDQDRKRDPTYDNNVDNKPVADTRQVQLSVPGSEVKVSVVSTGSSSKMSTTTRPIQFHTGQTLTEQPKEGDEKNAGSREDPRASPRPLHFKVGYAYSLEPKPGASPRKENESTPDPSSPTDQGAPARKSVADMIQKLNAGV